MYETMHVHVKAKNVTGIGGGVYVLELEGTQLSEEARATLSQLYPNFLDKAYQLLSQEALVASLASDYEINRAASGEAEVIDKVASNIGKNKGKYKPDTNATTPGY